MLLSIHNFFLKSEYEISLLEQLGYDKRWARASTAATTTVPSLDPFDLFCISYCHSIGILLMLYSEAQLGKIHDSNEPKLYQGTSMFEEKYMLLEWAGN